MGLGYTVGQSGTDPGTRNINFQYAASVVQTQELPSHGYSHALPYEKTVHPFQVAIYHEC